MSNMNHRANLYTVFNTFALTEKIKVQTLKLETFTP